MSLASQIRGVLADAVAEGQTPGGVVLIGRERDVLCHEAVGERMIDPEHLPMEPDTVFDLASVTKPVATATAVMQLIERGRLALKDPVTHWYPSCHSQITIWHLLTHSSGLPAYKKYPSVWGEELPLSERRERVTQDICGLPLEYETGHGFTYSCLGFILLTSIFQKVAEMTLDQWTATEIAGPLGLHDTCFNPPPELVARSAATERLATGTLRGVVHDENARYLGGIGGNAGLFSTAADLARFARMLLNGGELDGVRILNTETVVAMTTPQLQLPNMIRGFGWDIDTDYSPCLRGDFPIGGFGHSGYTGTSLWFEPSLRLYIIILTNRVHLSREASVQNLRRAVANITAHAVT